jgi:hypothetical protein
MPAGPAQLCRCRVSIESASSGAEPRINRITKINIHLVINHTIWLWELNRLRKQHSRMPSRRSFPPDLLIPQISSDKATASYKPKASARELLICSVVSGCLIIPSDCRSATCASGWSGDWLSSCPRSETEYDCAGKRAPGSTLDQERRHLLREVSLVPTGIVFQDVLCVIR